MKKRLISIVLCCILSLSATSFTMAATVATPDEANPIDINNGTSSGLNSTNKSISDDEISKLFGQAQEYFSQGLYLEAAAIANDTLYNYTLSDSWKELFELMSSACDYKYQEYLLKQQRYTYRVSGWGMNVICRGDMEPSESYEGLSLYNNHSNRSLYINSYKIGDVVCYKENFTIQSAKQFIDKYISEVKNLKSSRYSEYGRNFEIISANNIEISGFSAYQVVYRETEYTNRYWTEGDYWMYKRIGFQYGNWIYIIDASENSYNWSDDFWNAMETVINGISFS